MSAGSFDAALKLVLELEGGFVQDPRDPGGATNMGITRATLASARGRPASVADVRSLTRAEAASIYRHVYWDPISGDELPPGLDLAVFDYAVNSGAGRAVRALQGVVGTARDGRIGPATLVAARASDAASAITALTRQRIGFLKGLSTWSVFGRGWTNRLNRTEAAALALARTSPRSEPLGIAELTPAPAGEKENTMLDTKTALASRTVWANLIGLASLGLGLFGVKTGSLDANGLADAASQLVAGASFIASTIFRVAATKQIGSIAS